VDPETGHVYVACAGEGQVQIIDAGGGGVVGALTPTAMPVSVTIDEFTRQVYVGSGSQRRIFGYDLREGADLGSMGICGLAVDLVQNPRSRQILAAVPMCREVAVVRLDIGLEFAALTMPAAPDRLTFDADHRQLLVLFVRDGTLAVCHPDRGSVQSLVRVGDDPYAVVAP
jgi:DNA-binding beta-propeller fold protein YncE